MKQYKAIDLFAGIGGIRLGFDNAFKDEIKTVFVCEWDKAAQKTYKANFNDDFEIAGDITKIDPFSVPRFDICLAGFPCQAFSIEGRKQGFNDSKQRGTLFFEIVTYCEIHQPKVIFLENVKNLVTHDKGRTMRMIVSQLEMIGYNVFYKVLNSQDFDVPQSRERVYIVGFRTDINSSEFEWPKPTNSCAVIAEVIEPNPVPAKYYVSERALKSLKAHKERHQKKGGGFGYIIREIDKVAGTLAVQAGGRDRNMIIDGRPPATQSTNYKGEINKEYTRRMTPREMARLQGYPEDFKLPEQDTNAYKQISNSVTVPVIEEIAHNIKRILDKDAKTGMWAQVGRKAIIYITQQMLMPDEHAINS